MQQISSPRPVFPLLIPVPFEEYDVTFQGITNALGFEAGEGALRVWGDYEAYKAEVVAIEETRGSRRNAFTIVRLTMPTPAPQEVHVATRGAEEDFGVPPLPAQATGNPAFEKKLALHAATPAAGSVVPTDILNKLSVDTERLHLWVKGHEVGYEILGENADANYWINAIELLGKVADRVRKG